MTIAVGVSRPWHQGILQDLFNAIAADKFHLPPHMLGYVHQVFLVLFG